MTTDPQLPPAVSKTAPDTQHPDRLTLEQGRYLAEQLVGRTVERDQLRDENADLHAEIADLRDRLNKSEGGYEVERTFTFRPAGEPEDVTVALHSLSDCPVCGHPIAAGAFVVVSDDPDDPEGPDRWAHESCARPQNPTRPALNADQTRARS